MTKAELFASSTYPLATLDPEAPLDDLEPLARLIGDDVRVVAIGESVHAGREFYLMRHRLLRFLVERLGFAAIAWESGFPESFAVDEYVRGTRSDRRQVLNRGMTMHLGRCEEMGDLVDWLRSRNANSERPVRFYGLDLPGSTASFAATIAAVASYLEPADPGFGARLARLRQLVAKFGPSTEEAAEEASGDDAKIELEGAKIVARYAAVPAEERNELTGLLADLAVRFDAMRRTYVEREGVELYQIARQRLHVASRLDLQLRAVAALMAGDAAACEANVRDLSMAETVEWILRRHERVVVLAHNGHIQRAPIATVPGMTPVDPLGIHLQRRLGSAYLVLGTTCGGGDVIVPRTEETDGERRIDLVIRDLPPVDENVADGLLDAHLTGPALVDLRTLDEPSSAAIDAAPRMRVLDLTIDIDVRQAFDLIVHVPRVSIWKSDTNAGFPDLRAGAGVER